MALKILCGYIKLVHSWIDFFQHTETGTYDNNTNFNKLLIKWNMLFSSDILDQFVKRDLFSMKEVVICLFPTFFPWRLVFVPGEIIIGLATINKTAFYHLIFLNGEIWSWNFSLIGSQLNLISNTGALRRPMTYDIHLIHLTIYPPTKPL